MDCQGIRRHDNVLERLLVDANAEPTNLPLSLLEDITNGFSIDNRIGIGGFAVVYKGMVGKWIVAVKKLSNTFNIEENKFHGEVKCLMKAKHENIVRFLGYCAETQGKMEDYEGKLVMADLRNWLLCFEYVPNGSLDKHIADASNGLEWRERYVIIRGICDGLHYLHKKYILHLDLKPANILLDDHMIPKIADFGLSRCFDEGQTSAITKHLCGSLGYFAPELIRGQISFKSDIFSLGVIIIEILTGEKSYPEDEKVVASWMRRLDALEGDMQLEQVRVCTKIGVECMDLDPSKRPLAGDIINRLDKTGSVDYSKKTGIGSSSAEQSHNLVELTDFIQENEIVEWRSFNNDDNDVGCVHRFDAEAGALLPFQKKINNDDLINFTEVEIRRITDNYNTLIGRGAFAEVYRGVLDDGSPVAVKILNSSTLKEEFAKEISIHCQIKHKNTVSLLGYCSEGNASMMVTEYSSGGNLRDFLDCRDYPISLDTRLGIALDCAEALSYMHTSMSPSIIHGDINPRNILLDGNFGAKLSDFGISRMFSMDGSTQYTLHVMGTIGYIDPVYVESGRIDPKNDVYGFGVILVELVTRKHARDTDLIWNFTRSLQKGKNARKMFDSEIAYASNIKVLYKIGNLAAECLRIEIDKRPEMKDVAARLRKLTNDHCQQAEEKTAAQWTLWGKQDSNTTQNERIAGSNSIMFKLNSLGIFSSNEHTNFKRNGGPILQNVKGLRIFTKSELRKITKTNSEFLSVGSFGRVYKGILPDNKAVAVMSSIKVTEAIKDQFIKQIGIQTHMMHMNIPKLVGCCLEVDVPMLVYEFAAKGSLQDILHGDSRDVRLPLDLRLDIAIGTAQGLAYVHSYQNRSMRHGDVKPDNILLDEKFVPKILDFGLWKLLREEYYFGKIVAGDMAYIDPMFIKTGRLTDKSDVYSFGAILLELITKKRSVYDEYCSLILEFRKVYQKEKSGRAMLDKEITTEEDIFYLEEIGKLAIGCLKENIEERPEMAEVVERLVMLRRDRRQELGTVSK
uniref:Uncharacterized protein n=1 Tax=Avena sativa TaxID=4498 RepID=A0ACD5VEJ3_AVESA